MQIKIGINSKINFAHRTMYAFYDLDYSFTLNFPYKCPENEKHNLENLNFKKIYEEFSKRHPETKADVKIVDINGINVHFYYDASRLPRMSVYCVFVDRESPEFNEHYKEEDDFIQLEDTQLTKIVEIVNKIYALFGIKH